MVYRGCAPVGRINRGAIGDRKGHVASLYCFLWKTADAEDLDPSRSRARARRGTGTILLVEDNPSVMEVTARMLEKTRGTPSSRRPTERTR
jgi:hypothetical protein